MTSTTPTKPYDPFSPDSEPAPNPLRGWEPTRGFGRGYDTWEPDGPWFTEDEIPPVPEGYEKVPGRQAEIRRVRPDVAEETPADPAPAAESAVRPSGRPGPTRRPLRRAAPRVVPATGVETREPADQNAHTMAMINSHQLGGTPMLVAMVASVEIAITASRERRPFGKTERELTHVYLAGKTGLSEETVRLNAEKAVKLGFLERTDNAQGGKRDASGAGRNRSTYRARIPAYMPEDPEHVAPEPTP